ncbi:MAG: pectinesterase family protein [bacterium]|nr:pectinesterase family protein [bacterium]
MIKLKETIKAEKKLKLAVFAFLALAIVALPIFAFSSRKSDVYVNAKAGEQRDGSTSHPYKTISEAIDHSKNKDEVEIHVAKGEYKENITLRNGMKLFGENRENTIIKAKKEKNETVSMKNDSTIDGFTIKNGKMGIWVEKDAKASIINCVVKDNGNGIAIQGGDIKKSNQVSISKTKIRNNSWSGIYSAGIRRISITDSEILGNKKDGIDLARGTSAWIGGTSIKDNKGSGMKLVVDQSSVWTKNNDIRRNSREGIEISSYGTDGRIDISKTKIVDNGRFGIARLQRAGNTSWTKNLTFGIAPEFWGNISGDISSVLYIK